jgi:hypothetical protein
VLAEGAVEVAPGFEFGDAIGAPAAAEELDDQWAEGEQVGRADELAVRVFEGELGSDCADGQDFLFDAGGEELGDGLFADGQARGRDQVAGVGGDLVELVLEKGHHLLPVKVSNLYSFKPLFPISSQILCFASSFAFMLSSIVDLMGERVKTINPPIFAEHEGILFQTA